MPKDTTHSDSLVHLRQVGLSLSHSHYREKEASFLEFRRGHKKSVQEKQKQKQKQKKKKRV
jgi:hypothetical protein